MLAPGLHLNTGSKLSHNSLLSVHPIDLGEGSTFKEWKHGWKLLVRAAVLISELESIAVYSALGLTVGSTTLHSCLESILESCPLLCSRIFSCLACCHRGFWVTRYVTDVPLLSCYLCSSLLLSVPVVSRGPPDLCSLQELCGSCRGL